MNAVSKNRVLRIPTAAGMLGVARSTLYGMMDRGELEYVKFGRSRRIPLKAILALIKRNSRGSRAGE